MENNKFSFRGIQDLCNIHLHDILERKDLRVVLLGRRVRFINPTGKFDYTYFGDFYFDGDVMMFITKDKNYVSYHKPDKLKHTLWSTVPVIFAGVDTGFKDDMRREIFTGDVVTYQHYTSVVRYYGFSDIPGLIGDNCDIQFDESGTMHKDGTAFVNVSPTMFKEYDPLFVRWPADGFCQYGPSFVEIREKASVAMDAPTFMGEGLKKKVLTKISYGELDEVLTDNVTLVYLRDSEAMEDENVEPSYMIFADNLPDVQHKKVYEIPLAREHGIVEDLRESFNKFLLYAHDNPQETFVLADFYGIFGINSYSKFEVVNAFDEWFEFNIRNVILPRWIFFALGSLHGIGQD